MRCYICNRKIVDNPTEADECKAHGEHIIHNGIRGKLISRTILCEECGSNYSREDSNFCGIFAPFIAALKDRLIPADHGKDKDKVLRGSLFNTPTTDINSPSKEVAIKKGVVVPILPYYEIDKDRLILYAERHRVDQFEKEVGKKLKKDGMDIGDYHVEKVSDIHDKGYLAYYFSKGNASFNLDFKNGMVKIAIEYALYCNIPREQLNSVLSINSDGSAYIDNTNAKLIPFIPSGLFDCVFEDYRYSFEEGYPSHTLKLFSIKFDSGKACLYCYIDLFSTFQYYVVLNENYKGVEINELYSQRMIPKTIEKPDVTQYDPSDLDIIIREYRIDMNQCSSTSYKEQKRYVQECIRKYPLHTYDLQQALSRANEKIQRQVSSYLIKKRGSKLGKEAFTSTKTVEPYTVPASVEVVIDSFINKMDTRDADLLFEMLNQSVNLNNYRKYVLDVIDGDVMNFSQPDESMKVLDKCIEFAREYTEMKFSHLSCLCYNPSLLV